MESPECFFCRKLASPGGLPADELVWEFEYSVALLGRWQYYQGYCVIVTRRHATELFHLSDIERRGYFDEMCLLAQSIDEIFHPRKLNYELLGNQVPHLHWHLFPRYPDDEDPLQPVWSAIDRAEHNPAERGRLETGPVDRATTIGMLRERLQKRRA